MNEALPREPALAARLRRAQAVDAARPAAPTRSASRPATASAAVRRTRAAHRSGSWAASFVAWCALVGLSWCASTLAGQTMMEQARREGLRAQERARQAGMEAAVLRDRLRRLTSMRAVDEWAAVRGFAPQEQATVVLGGPMRVAGR